jgi:hypothetical protein
MVGHPAQAEEAYVVEMSTILGKAEWTDIHENARLTPLGRERSAKMVLRPAPPLGGVTSMAVTASWRRSAVPHDRSSIVRPLT